MAFHFEWHPWLALALFFGVGGLAGFVAWIVDDVLAPVMADWRRG